jgi:hypothetical protein
MTGRAETSSSPQERQVAIAAMSPVIFGDAGGEFFDLFNAWIKSIS